MTFQRLVIKVFQNYSFNENSTETEVVHIIVELLLKTVLVLFGSLLLWTFWNDGIESIFAKLVWLTIYICIVLVIYVVPYDD